MISVFIWWLIIQILGLIALPAAYWVFRWLPDRGYVFAKAFGLLLTSYLLWLGASTGFLTNSAGGALGAFLLVAGASAWLLLKQRDHQGMRLAHSLADFLKKNTRLVLSTEALFLTALVAWALLRAFATDRIMPAGGEKFMEIAFLNGILNSPTFPPLDPWLSGFAISYYYFGYVMMALMTRLSGVAPGVGFDLYDALLFALTVLGAFGVVYNLIAGSRRVEEAQEDRPAIAYGLLGALFVAIIGNLEGLLEMVHARGLLPQAFWDWIDIPDLANAAVTGSWDPGSAGGWWWWRASRVLQDRDLFGQPAPFSPITEFPFFSFLLGDNHPHVLTLPFTLLAIALALNLLRRTVSQAASAADQPEGNRLVPWWNPVRFAFGGSWALFLVYAVAFGALGFLNTWDLPIYIGLAGLAYGVGAYSAQRKFDWPLVLRTAGLAAGLLLAAVLLYFLFYLGFSSQAGGIAPHVYAPTRLVQYLVMFGVFLFILAWFLVAYYLHHVRRTPERRMLRTLFLSWIGIILSCAGIVIAVILLASFSDIGRQLISGDVQNLAIQQALGGMSLSQAVQRVLLARLTDPWLFLLLTFLLALVVANLIGQAGSSGSPDTSSHTISRSASDLFTFLLVFTGLALTFSVEFFYLRDGFGVRMNTVFKFYYQGWILLGCASAYAVWWLLNPGKAYLGAVGRTLFLGGTTVLIAAGLVYPAAASLSRTAGFRGPAHLDAARNIAAQNPDDWSAVEWLKQVVRQNGEVPVILEAPGKSYNYEGRISAFSGVPTVLGWSYHEGQWRGDYTEQSLREPDIATIYTTGDGKAALALLDKWQVSYVVLGPTERSYIQETCAQPDRKCISARALQKFETVLVPVFEQGEVTIYEVPGS